MLLTCCIIVCNNLLFQQWGKIKGKVVRNPATKLSRQHFICNSIQKSENFWAENQNKEDVGAAMCSLWCFAMKHFSLMSGSRISKVSLWSWTTDNLFYQQRISLKTSLKGNIKETEPRPWPPMVQGSIVQPRKIFAYKKYLWWNEKYFTPVVVAVVWAGLCEGGHVVISGVPLVRGQGLELRVLSKIINCQ